MFCRDAGPGSKCSDMCLLPRCCTISRMSTSAFIPEPGTLRLPASASRLPSLWHAESPLFREIWMKVSWLQMPAAESSVKHKRVFPEHWWDWRDPLKNALNSAKRDESMHKQNSIGLF